MERDDVIAYRVGPGTAKPTWLSERLEWFQDLKFGLILHWAPYCLWDCCESWPLSPGDPWARADDMECWTSRGKDLATFQRDYWQLNQSFNPTNFDPQKWAALAKRAGARYLAFTTKHHDGFCMWDTATTDYRITGEACPFHRDPRADVFGEVCVAFREQGLAISAYFSKADWHCPDYWDSEREVLGRGANTVDDPDAWSRFVAFTHAQIRELMSNYGKIDVLWLDGGWVKDEEDIDMPKLAAMARELQPGLIIANRTVGDEYEDFVTPEREIPEQPLGVPWESCLVMAENWKYHPRDRYRPCEEILEMMVDTISKGGNFLLGFGPTPLGEFPPEAVQRLTVLGDWMEINGEAVHGSRAIRPYRDGQLRFTQRAGYVYAFSFSRGDLQLSQIVPNSGDVVLLGCDEPVMIEVLGGHVLLRAPSMALHLPLPLVYRWLQATD